MELVVINNNCDYCKYVVIEVAMYFYKALVVINNNCDYCKYVVIEVAMYFYKAVVCLIQSRYLDTLV